MGAGTPVGLASAWNISRVRVAATGEVIDTH